MKLSKIFEAIGGPEPVFEGNGWAAHCPAHDDTKPSLRVAVSESDKLLLKCRAGCETDAVLNAIGLGFQDMQPVDIDVAKKGRRVSDDGSPVEGAEQALMAAYLHEAAEELNPAALNYLKDRFGIEAEQARALGIGFDDGDSDYHLLGPAYRAVSRVVVPFRDFDGVPRGFQGRAIGAAKVRWSGPSNPPEGGSWSKYAWFPADAGLDYVIVTEGPGDALAAFSAGFDSVAIRGASMAKAVVDDLVANLQGRRIVLAGDNDPAGQNFNETLGEALLERGMVVHVLQLPAGVGDVGEWFEGSKVWPTDFQRAVGEAPLLRASAAPQDDAVLLTDHGLAKHLVDHFDGRLLHSPGLGFFIFQAGRWVRDTLDQIRVGAHEAADILEEEARDDVRVVSGGEPWTKMPKGVAAQKLRSQRGLDQVLVELAAEVNTDPEAFDQKHHLLSVRNGTVDLRDGSLRPHDKADLITHRLEVSYDPEASAPRWEQFLQEVFPEDPELPGYMKRLVGYGVTGSTSEQCFAVLWGRGANGKSVFTDTLAEVFEDVTETTPFATFESKPSGGIPNDLAALRGSRLVFASEGDAGARMAEATLKRVTGQDKVTARFMRQEFFSFRPTFLIWMATNHKPSFRGQDEGLWRRVKLIPWVRYFAPEERDHYLARTLLGEAEGIVTWAIQGAVEWYSSGLQDPPSVIEATANYRNTSDALSGFLPGVFELDEGGQILGNELYQAYQKWADEEMLPAKEVWSRRAFYDALEERGCWRKDVNKGVMIVGVKRTDEDASAHVEETNNADSIFEKGAF